MRRLEKLGRFRLALPALMLLILLTGVSGADYCTTLLTPSPPAVVPGISNSNLGGLQTIVQVSFLIIVMMTAIAAFAYMIGSAIKVDKLTRFAKTELGEIAVTFLVVFIFLGSFAGINALTAVPSSYLALAPSVLNYNIFMQDCETLSGVSGVALGDLGSLYLDQDIVNLASSISFSYSVSMEGFSVTPYSGITLENTVLIELTNILLALVILPLAGSVLVALFYLIAPLFLFLGIILRTLPWTRAAGGSFLAVFVAFYIMFPLLLWLMIGGVNLAGYVGNGYSVSTALGNLSPTTYWLPSGQDIGISAVITLVDTAVGQMFYVIFAIIFSLIISYDFMEAVGDLLGAPSLSARETLKKVI